MRLHNFDVTTTRPAQSVPVHSGRVEVIDRPRIAFTVRIHETNAKPFLSRSTWAAIWERAEDIGIGAQRSRGDGQFDLEVWEKAA